MTNRKPKTTWTEKISAFIGKIFDFIKLVIHGVWTFVENTMNLLTFFFTYFIRVLANPTTPCVVAIMAFMLVFVIAANQWYAIGIWGATAMGIKGGFYGVGSGVVGMLFGLGINVYQLAPQLWKLRRDFTEAYAALKVDIHKDTSEESVTDKQRDWFSYDHATLKTGRLITYSMETAIVLCYAAFAEKFAFLALVQAAVSLVLPEKALQAVASTVSLLGEVSNRVADSQTGQPQTGNPAQGRATQI